MKETGRRANDSQILARAAEKEAKEVAETAIYMIKDYQRCMGWGVWFSDM